MFFPIMIDIYHKEIVIVGGGEVAYRKSIKLLEFGGNIRVISPKVTDKFSQLKEEYKGNINFTYSLYEKKYIEGAFLVIAATSSKDVNMQISRDCNDLNVLVNSVDSREDSDFITSSIINNDNLTISISTMGSFPYLSKKIRMDMEDNYKKFNKEYMYMLEKIRMLILDNYRDRIREIMDYALELDINGLNDLLIKLERKTFK